MRSPSGDAAGDDWKEPGGRGHVLVDREGLCCGLHQASRR